MRSEAIKEKMATTKLITGLRQLGDDYNLFERGDDPRKELLVRSSDWIEDKDAELAALRTTIAEREEQLKRAEGERDELRSLATKQRDEIETINWMVDAVECLRNIGKVIGCDHVDGSDGRRQLVNCVEQTLAAAERDNERLREGIEAIRSTWSSDKSLVQLREALSALLSPPTPQGEEPTG